MYILVMMKVLLASENPSGSSGSGSENVKWWKATEVKILISAYKDHQENLNNSKSSKGEDMGEDF